LIDINEIFGNTVPTFLQYFLPVPLGAATFLIISEAKRISAISRNGKPDPRKERKNFQLCA